MEHRRRHICHLLRRHGQRHKSRNAIDSVKIDLLQPLFISLRNVRRPAFRIRPFRWGECRQLHDFACFRIHQSLISRRTDTVRAYADCWHLIPPFGIGATAPFLFDKSFEENMRPDIKKERVQLTTVQVFSKSVPASSFWCWGVRVGTPTSSCFRVSRSLTYAVCLRSPSPSASLRATHPASVHPLSAVRYRPPLRAPWVDDSETSASRRHTLPAPIPAKLLARLCNLLMVLYPKVLIRKEGTCCHAPLGFINQPNYPLRIPA